MKAIERLQAWFLSQCDGDWEHTAGIVISTLDNPGWFVDVDLSGTSVEARSFQAIKVERAEQDWLHAARTETKFKIYCGPGNLEESLTLFCDWAGA
jgi:hypothetical protein